MLGGCAEGFETLRYDAEDGESEMLFCGASEELYTGVERRDDIDGSVGVREGLRRS